MKLCQKFEKSAEDSGLGLLYPDQSQTHIESLFVYPELQTLRRLSERAITVMNGSLLLPRLAEVQKWLIFGDDQSGKTTFSKKLFLDAFSHGYTPLLIDGSSIKSSDLEKIISSVASDIYPGVQINDLLDREDLVCIIDDFSKSPINESAKKRLINSLDDTFHRVIIIAEESFQFGISDFPCFDDYEKVKILSFGHVCRSELINKWVDLELGEEIHESQLWKRKDELRTHVDALVRKNIVPSRPVYILMIIQSFNLVKTRSFELTSYGHCYQYLIYQALERTRIKPSEFGQYLNFLSELGRAILDSRSEFLDEEGLKKFFTQYLKKFVTTDKDKMVDALIEASILERGEGHIRFRYRYLFYFFASKNLAENLHRDDSAKSTISHLISTIYTEKSSNVVLFLSHHSKDPWILDEILYSMIDIFPEEKEATLEADSLQFLKDFTNSIADVVIESRDVRQERRKQDVKRDILEREQEEALLDDKNTEEDSEIAETEEELSIFMRKIEKTFRTTEVCGQILRNRIGSLERENLELLYNESITVLLKFLNIVLETSKVLQEEGIRLIESALRNSPDASDEEITKRARTFYMELNYALIFSVLQKISFSLGSDTGKEIYKSVAQEKDNAAVHLVQEVIELQFEKKLDHKAIAKLHNRFVASKNSVCDRLLKMIVVYHCYMHEVTYRDRQSIATTFNLEIYPLQIMESRKQQQQRRKNVR